MQIPINKDIEEAYRDEPIRGFTLREVAHIMLGALIIGGVTALVWWKTGLSPDISVFVGIPFGLPVLFMGFRRFQGLTAGAYLKEIIYEKRVGILTYDADELPRERHVFTMERRKKKSRRFGR